MKKVQLNKTGTAWLVISFDDYAKDNVAVAARMQRMGWPVNFYIEVGTSEARRQIAELHKLGAEIGSHTVTHPPDIKRLDAAQLESEIKNSKLIIEDITGVECEDFAYPRGRFNDAVVECVKDAGYKTARTTHVLHTDPGDPFRMETTIHMFDGRKEYKGRPWDIMAQFYLDDVIRKGGTFNIWGHLKEMSHNNGWHRFWKFMDALKSKNPLSE